MAKVAFAVTQSTRKVGFDNLAPNTKVFTRVYWGQKGGLKFTTSEDQAEYYPESTILIAQHEAHKTAKGKILFTPKAILDLRKDMVNDKIITREQADNVKPGRFGTFWYDGADVVKK